ncbi:hypothetical protein [Breoghania sp. L-A4]|uniref:hypothetical protein n=1 Tax=Breoghania sp. L-A4 TaxID=2304600 RepID=UPI0013C34CEF|nr:hypothetical protein [Breoghania sp. L-A4]
MQDERNGRVALRGRMKASFETALGTVENDFRHRFLSSFGLEHAAFRPTRGRGGGAMLSSVVPGLARPARKRHRLRAKCSGRFRAFRLFLRAHLLTWYPRLPTTLFRIIRKTGLSSNPADAVRIVCLVIVTLADNFKVFRQAMVLSAAQTRKFGAKPTESSR